MSDYLLRHRNDTCAILMLDDSSSAVISTKILEPELTPFLGNADSRKLKQWWTSRAVPGSRKMTQDIIRKSGCINTEDYLAKNLALSLTDNYWVCPVEMRSLKWEDVCLYNMTSPDYRSIPYHNATSYDPNATLGGQMEKYWDIKGDIPVLVKHATAYNGQQAANEMFASKIHEHQHSNIPFTKYQAYKSDIGGLVSKCNAFTNRDIEFVSAYEVIESRKLDNSISLYDSYIDICAEHGISKDTMRDFMDYQTITDFILTNTDEHLMNFGILRDASTMRIVGPAPIFDSGNSMFYNHVDRNTPMSRFELLDIEITSFHSSEEHMLRHVTKKDIVDIDQLPPVKYVKEFYIEGGIPEEKATYISKNYDTKIKMTKEFIKGKTISFYNEKKRDAVCNIKT